MHVGKARPCHVASRHRDPITKTRREDFQFRRMRLGILMEGFPQTHRTLCKAIRADNAGLATMKSGDEDDLVVVRQYIFAFVLEFPVRIIDKYENTGASRFTD